MNETITNEALDLIVFADDCKCTGRHDEDLPTCSHTVTHFRRFVCGGAGLICANAAAYIYECLENGDVDMCDSCGRLLEVCWKVIPV